MDIRLKHTDSVTSNDSDSFVEQELKQTTKLLHHLDMHEIIDVYEVFEEERNKCNNFRLITTIKPYCSNVLFNPLTEIVKDEGSEDVKVIEDEGNTIDGDVYGLKSGVSRNYMINNTEYSRPEIGYVYHPGYDFFDNHILRDKSFKVVCDNNGQDKNVFNTLSDYMRTDSGENIPFQGRTDIKTIRKNDKTHLYTKDDIMNFADGEAINNNLVEENGWFGFVNASSIISKDVKNDTDLGIRLALNDRKACEFVDMYPDRTLFSFNPKVNNFRKRLEYNWDICLTYPYREFVYHDLFNNGEYHGLKLMTITKTTGQAGEGIFVFRSYIRHGLSKGDMIAINDDLENTYKVANVGDLKGNQQEYYFYINDMSFLEKIAVTGELTDENINEAIQGNEYYFCKVVNGVASEYYARVFKKIPNLMFKQQNLTDGIAENREDEDGKQSEFNAYISKNASENNQMYDFDKEVYNLGFSSTIYTDNVTQVTFPTNIDLSHLIDNKGRPLSEFYLTIVKNNRGYQKWYEENDYGNEKVEYSHCFGPITCGVEMSHTKYDGDLRADRAVLGDIMLLNNLDVWGAQPWSLYDSERDITIHPMNDEFLGDIVEYIPKQAREVVLTPFMHRFNTYQREHETQFNTFTYNDIETDDYDKDGFKVISTDDVGSYTAGHTTLSSLRRPEGYYYKCHYRIPVKEVGRLQQASHFNINVKRAEPIQLNGIFIQVKTKLPHHLNVGDEIMVWQNDTLLFTKRVTYVTDKITFAFEKPTIDEFGTWVDFAIVINNGNIVLRRTNDVIPSYATYVGENTYLWRELLNIGNKDVVDLPEYPYTNNAFYIHQDINFYLHRQDPHGENGLYCKNGFPNDVVGDKLPESNYNYKDEDSIVC